MAKVKICTGLIIFAMSVGIANAQQYEYIFTSRTTERSTTTQTNVSSPGSNRIVRDEVLKNGCYLLSGYDPLISTFWTSPFQTLYETTWKHHLVDETVPLQPNKSIEVKDVYEYTCRGTGGPQTMNGEARERVRSSVYVTYDEGVTYEWLGYEDCERSERTWSKRETTWRYVDNNPGEGEGPLDPP